MAILTHVVMFLIFSHIYSRDMDEMLQDWIDVDKVEGDQRRKVDT